MIWQSNYKAYGYPRITLALQGLGIKIGPKRVFQLIREMKIHSLMNRSFKKPGTHVDYAQRPNLVKHRPKLSIWRTNITYLELRPGTWVYLSSVYEPKALSFLLLKLAIKWTPSWLLTQLIKHLKTLKTSIHSDMGSQYTSHEVETLLERHQITHSYSKQGYPYDNS